MFCKTTISSKCCRIFLFSSILTCIVLIGNSNADSVTPYTISKPTIFSRVSEVAATRFSSSPQVPLSQVEEEQVIVPEPNTNIQQNSTRRHKSNGFGILRSLITPRVAGGGRGVESPRALGLLTLTAIIAIPLIIIFIILLFLPIPVAISSARRMAKEIATRDECLERVACEALRITNAFEYDAKWIQKFLRKAKSNSIWIERVSRGAHMTECGLLACDPISAFSGAIR